MGVKISGASKDLECQDGKEDGAKCKQRFVL